MNFRKQCQVNLSRWGLCCALGALLTTLNACRDEAPLLRSEGEQVAQPGSGGRFITEKNKNLL